jgi:hypothetical protein
MKNKFSILVPLFLLVFFATIFVAFMIINNVTNLPGWGDRFALGQLLVEFFLIPVTILGFAVTVTEFRKSQQTAELDVNWMLNGGQLTKIVNNLEYPESGNFLTPQIVLTNSGNTPSIHYQINFEFPVEYGRAQMKLNHWKNTTTHIKKFIFSSAEQFIIFPSHLTV